MSEAVAGIKARFPLGVFVGHRPDGSPDALPSTLRLHAALVAAACAGSSAESNGVGLVRTSAATRALEWIEDNPPDFVELPPARENRQINEYAYRDEGVIERPGKAPMRRKTRRALGTGTAISAPIGWGWECVPADVAASLAMLCEDVPCLGEADSPVVLEFGQITPTHRRSGRNSPFARVGLRIATPTTGRLGELDELHRIAQPRDAPSIARDRWKEKELPSPPVITHERSVEVGYDLVGEPDPPAGPWRYLIHIGIGHPISNSDRVAWSVALHRAMVAALDTDAPGLITGRYDQHITPPANRVAIQPLDGALLRLSCNPSLGPGIAVLVPDEALEVTNRALAKVARLYRRGSAIPLEDRTILDAATFWHAPAFGMVRTWESLPAVMPETRRPRRPKRRSWTLAESALLSVGFVFRDELDVPDCGSAEERYTAIVDAVELRGVKALTVSPIPDGDVRKYAHKMPAGVVAQPYRLQLDGGSLLPDRGLIAIGQSRHLGGGLLCPVDRPEALSQAWSVTE